MRYYIAIDSGSNKTESVLFNETGKVLALDIRQGANSFDVGPAEAANRICEGILNLKANMPAGERLRAVYGAVSAAPLYPSLAKQAARAADNAPCAIEEDVTSIFAAVLGKEDGVCLISGAGSACHCRVAGKPLYRIGSSGYMLDTGGSGYVLGRTALIMAQRDRDGRGEKTLLTDIVERDMGESVVAHLPVIYEGRRAYISSFAHAVFEARRAGDRVARRIFDNNVDYYVEDLVAAREYMGKPCTAALGGGVFLAYPEYVQAIREKAPQDVTLKLIDVPAVYGSALEAVWLSNHHIHDDFRDNFLQSYVSFPSHSFVW